jgi:glycosyltransferase involved in cell wall biosynthesis
MSTATLLREGVASRGRPGAARPAISSLAKPRPHICFVAPHAWPVLSRDTGIQVVGGAEVQQSILARLLQRAGYRVSMICLDFGQPRRTEVDGITVHATFRPDAGVPVLRFFHPRLTAVWRALREVDADIYYHRSAAMLTGLVAEFCRRNGKRSVYAGASDMDFIPGSEQIGLARDRWLYHRGLRSVDAIVAQNARQLETCREHYGREAVLIPSCYELPASATRGSGPLGGPLGGDTVLWCGTVHTYKRPEILLELARRLPHRKFVIIGGPGVDESQTVPYFARIREAARALPNVEFTGFLPLAQVEPYFDRARVLVNSSDYEGMPNTFMQAWARGVPTVATVDVGARTNGEPVYCVFKNTEDAVAEIERLFNERLYWQRASARVREYFEANHSSAEALARYARLLEQLVP